MKAKTILLLLCMLLPTACTAPPTLAPTASPTETQAAAPAVSTPIPPAIQIDTEIACYDSPLEGGQKVASFQSGDTVPVVGKDDYGQYWVVIDPESHTGCWITREGTTAQGIVDYLPNLVPPPTPRPHKPAAPINLKGTLESCGPGPNANNKEWIPIVVLTWEDAADNENLYYVFRNGASLESVDRDATQYRDMFTILGNGLVHVTYTVQAYSRAGGESEPVDIEMEFVCQSGNQHDPIKPPQIIFPRRSAGRLPAYASSSSGDSYLY